MYLLEKGFVSLCYLAIWSDAWMTPCREGHCIVFGDATGTNARWSDYFDGSLIDTRLCGSEVSCWLMRPKDMTFSRLSTILVSLVLAIGLFGCGDAGVSGDGGLTSPQLAEPRDNT